MPRAKKLTDDLRNELNALVPTSDEAGLSTIQGALEAAKEEIVRIDERAEFAIQVVAQSIRTRAAVEKGRVLLQLQADWKDNPAFDQGWTEFLHELGSKSAWQWMNAAKLVEDNNLLFGSDDFIMNLSPHTMDTIHKLPACEKLEMLERVDAGEKLTQKQVGEVANKTTTKISKTAELLLAAREKKQAIESGEMEFADNKDYHNTRSANARTLENLEKQLEDLELQLQAEQVKAKADEKKLKKMAEELDSLKFDDELAREQRVKRISNTLTIQVPNIQGDIQRYWAEYDQYPDEYKAAIDGLIKDLAKLINK